MGGEKKFEGATLEEALGKASSSLGVPEPDLSFRILDTGRRGLFGLGTRNVCIAVDPGQDPGQSGMRKPIRSDELHGQIVPTGRRAGAGAGAGAARQRSDELRGPARRRGRRRSGGGDRKRRSDERPRRAERHGKQEPRAAKPREKGERTPEAAKVEGDIQRMLDLMSLDLRAEATASGGTVRLHLDGPDRNMLLDKDTELLSALQFLVNRMARRSWPDAGRVHLGCAGHEGQRDDDVVELVREVASQVARTGEPKRLDPMNPYERRLVHITVREFEDLSSRSEGDGFLKKVRIFQK